jgi:hypothetical protein
VFSIINYLNSYVIDGDDLKEFANHWLEGVQ